MLLLTIDRGDAIPAYRQICDRVMQLAGDGVLPPGTRLPPTRELAAILGVHRTTVVRAYRELRALGYLESRPGSYSVIRQRLRAPSVRAHPARATPLVRWTSEGSAIDAVPHEPPQPRASPGLIDFASHLPDPALAPHDYLRRCVKGVLAGRARDVLVEYPDPQGLASLREAIAHRMAKHGVATTADEVIVTNGAQQGLDLILRLLVRPGDRVAVESPGYGMALPLLRTHRARPLAIQMTAAGMELAHLERAFARHQVRLLYTMPNFQNPTGVTTSPAHREALLALCERHRVPLVEDGFDEELNFSGPAVLPIKSIDARGIVLYLGTLSKLVYPGLRIGWIVAPREAIAPLTALQRATSLGGNALAQAVAARLYAGSEFDVLLRRMHRTYQRRMQAMVAGLTEHLPPHVQWVRPRGGYLLWLHVTGGRRTEEALVARVEQFGVRVTPGGGSFARPSREAFLRLSIACASEAQITEGCRRLGAALR